MQQNLVEVLEIWVLNSVNQQTKYQVKVCKSLVHEHLFPLGIRNDATKPNPHTDVRLPPRPSRHPDLRSARSRPVSCGAARTPRSALAVRRAASTCS